MTRFAWSTNKAKGCGRLPVCSMPRVSPAEAVGGTTRPSRQSFQGSTETRAEQPDRRLASPAGETGGFSCDPLSGLSGRFLFVPSPAVLWQGEAPCPFISSFRANVEVAPSVGATTPELARQALIMKKGRGVAGLCGGQATAAQGRMELLSAFGQRGYVVPFATVH